MYTVVVNIFLTKLICRCDGQAWTGIRIYDEASMTYDWLLEAANGEPVNQALVNTLWDPTVQDPNEVTLYT